MIILRHFFLFLHKIICYGYSLESSLQGDSNEYHNICFYGDLTEIILDISPNALLNVVYWT